MKTQSRTRWLKFLFLVIAFVALAVPDASAKRIYWNNDGTGWSEVYAYTFGGSGSDSYGNIAKVNTTTNIDGIQLYYVDTPKDNIIFASSSSWSNQTNDLSASDGYVYGKKNKDKSSSDKFAEIKNGHWYNTHSLKIGVGGDLNQDGRTGNQSNITLSNNVYSPFSIASATNNNQFRFYQGSGSNWIGPNSNKTISDSEANGSTVFSTGGNGNYYTLPTGKTYTINVIFFDGDNFLYFTVSSVTLSDIQYQKGSSTGTSWASIKSGENLTDISGNYYFRATYSDGSTKWLAVDEITKNDNYNFTEKSSATASSFSSNVNSATIKATDASSLTVSNLVYKTESKTFYVDNSLRTGWGNIFVWYKLNADETAISDTWAGTTLGTSKDNMTATSEGTNIWKYVVTYPQDADLKIIINGGGGAQTSDIDVVDGTLYKLTSDGTSGNDNTYTTTANYTPRTLSAISLFKNGTSVGSLKDNNSLEVSGINENDVFLIEVDYSDGNHDYYYYNGTFNGSVSNGALVKGTSSSADWKAGDILKATFRIPNNDLSKINITVDEADINSWTYNPAAVSNSTDKTFNISKSDKRGNTVYYGLSSPITTAGTYTFSEVASDQTVTINMANPSSTLSWSTEGVPTLTVTDLDAKPDFYLWGENIGWSDQATYKFVYDASSDSYNLTLPNGLESQEIKFHCPTDYKWYGKNKNGEYSANIDLGVEETLYSDQNDNVWANNWGTFEPVYINIKLDGTTGLKVNVTKASKYYITGGMNNWTPEEFTKSGSTYTYTFTTTSSNTNFLIKKDNDGTLYGPSNKTSTTVTLGETYDLAYGTNNNQNFVIPNPGTYTVTLTLNGDTPSSIKVTGTSPGHSYKINYRWQNNENSWGNYIDLTKSSYNDNVYLGQISVGSNASTDKRQFCIMMDGDASKLYGRTDVYEFHNANSGSIDLQSGNSTSSVGNIQVSSSGTYYIAVAVDEDGIPVKIYVNYNADVPTNWPSIALNFKTLEQREGATTRTRDAVFVVADYLNNSKLAPDWEMQPTGNENEYIIRDVTLRGTTECGNAKLKFVVVDPSNDETITEYTPSADLDLETATKHQLGRTYTIKFNTSTKEVTITASQNKAIPFLGLVGYSYQQKSNEVTPNDATGTSRGWQESWVLYDENGAPIRDNNKEYMYNLQWPPRNPIQFAGVRDVSDRNKDVEMSSDNLTFKFEKDEEGVAINKTGSEWKEYLTDSAYGNLIVDKPTSNPVAPMRAAAARDGYLTDTQSYIRYIINNVWMLGATKIWTGWGGQINPNNNSAVWDGHMNYGFSDKKANDDGTEITAENAYQMIKDGGNFKFSEPTFFKTVELYLPVSSDGSPAGDPIFYTTLGKGEPSILAAAAHMDEAGTAANVNNTGKYLPKYNPDALPPSTTAASYRITLYDGMESSSDDKPSDWSFIRVVKEASGEEALQVLENNYNATSPNSETWYENGFVLDNGLYFYGIELFDADGKLIEQVASNTFSIANPNIKPSVKALQLLELTRDGYDCINQDMKYDFRWPADVSGKFGTEDECLYLTYQPGGTGDYFVVVKSDDASKNNKVYLVDTERARKAIRSHEVVWTTKYFVRAGNFNLYEADMLKNADIIESYETPTYSVTCKDKNNNTKDLENPQPIKSSNGTYGFITTVTDGSLEPYTFTSTISYKYTPVGGEKENATGTRTATVKPYVPGAYNLQYTYSQKRDETQVIPSGTKLKTTSSVVKADGTINLQGGLKSGGMVKDLELGQMAHRHLDCEFYFDRPNVSAAILDNYTIYYDLLFTNNDDKKNVLQDKIVYDDKNAGNVKGVKSYKVTAEQVHPNTTTFPILAVKGTVYVPKDQKPTVDQVEDIRNQIEDGSYTDYQMYHTPKYEVKTVKLSDDPSAPTYTGKMLIEYGVNTSEYIPMTIGTDNAKFTKVYEVWSDDVTRRANFQLEGITFSHKRQDGDGDELYGDVIHTAGGKDIALNAVYYDVETFTGNPTGIKYNEETGRLEQDKVYVDYYDAPLFTVDEDDKFTNDKGNYIAVGFAENVEPKDLKIEITPIYIFRRDPSVKREINGNGGNILGLKLLGQNTLDQESPEKSPSKAPIMRAESNAPIIEERIPGVLTMVDEGTEGSPIEYYTLRGAGSQVEVSSSIGVVTAVHGINAEAFDVEAEYYNLQGLRVTNPEKGQVYIVKRGAKATREFLY